MSPQTVQYMVEPISWVLYDYKSAVDAISRSAKETQRLVRQSEVLPTPASTSPPSLQDNEYNIPRVFVANLELDPAKAILVAQEALSHSIARLTVMLQDIEEEAALQRQQPHVDGSLQDKD